MRRFLWTLLPALVLLGLIGGAQAKEDPRRAMVQAATQDAIAALRGDVLNTPVSTRQNVGEFVDQLQSRDALDAVLQTARQVGGTRWIGDATCMVRVELSGDAVAGVLTQIVKSHPNDLPAPPATFQKNIDSWNGRTFSAEGSSTGPDAAKDLRPSDDNVPWRSVTPAARRDAVAIARAGAAERILNSLENVSISRDKTFGDALDVATVRSAMREWLSSRPVTDVHFHSDLNVELTVAAPVDELWRVFRTALEGQTQVPPPSSEAEWIRLRDDFVRHAAPGVGRALASAVATTAQAKAPLTLPDRPPRWANDSLDATGSAKKSDGKLITKKRAEDDAFRNLRRQVDKLPLGDGTVADAAKGSTAIDSAVERAIARARVYKVDYRSDGGVEVRYQLDLNVLWHEIASR